MRRSQKVIVPLAIAVVAILAAVLVRGQHYTATHPRPGPPVPCPADVRAQLGDVTEGATIAGFHVERITCGQPRVATVSLASGAARIDVLVAARGAITFTPPVTTVRTAIYFNRVGAQGPSDAEIKPVIDAIANHVANADSRVPKPSGW